MIKNNYVENFSQLILYCVTKGIVAVCSWIYVYFHLQESSFISKFFDFPFYKFAFHKFWGNWLKLNLNRSYTYSAVTLKNFLFDFFLKQLYSSDHCTNFEMHRQKSTKVHILTIYNVFLYCYHNLLSKHPSSRFWVLLFLIQKIIHQYEELY